MTEDQRPPIRGVAFDWFGVCGQKLIDAWESALGLGADSPMREPFFANLDDWATNEIDGMTFLERVLTSVDHDPEEHNYLLTHPGVIYMDVLNTAKKLRFAGYKTALISDNFKEMAPAIEEKIGGFSQYFGTVMLSNELGFTKQDPVMFRMMADHMDLRPANILVIDDRDKNLFVAIEEGFRVYGCLNPSILPIAIRHYGLQF